MAAVGGPRFWRMRFAGKPAKPFSESRAGVALVELIAWGRLSTGVLIRLSECRRDCDAQFFVQALYFPDSPDLRARV